MTVANGLYDHIEHSRLIAYKKGKGMFWESSEGGCWKRWQKSVRCDRDLEPYASNRLTIPMEYLT